MVLPLEFAPKADDAAPTRDVEWTPSDRGNFKSPLEQKLTDGWLNSRTPTQFITSRIRKTSAKLEIQPAADGQSLKVANHLATPILRLIVAGENGKYYAAEQIETGAVSTLSLVDEDRIALKTMVTALSESQPRRPDLMVNHDNRSFFGLNGQRSYGQNVYGPGWNYRTSGGNEPAPMQSTGILERSLTAIQEELLSGQLPPRSYIAIVEHSPEMQLGAPSAHEEASLHVVVGSW